MTDWAGFNKQSSTPILDILLQSRQRLLQVAADDVRKWCAPSSERVGNKRPDTYWIELFDWRTNASIEPTHAHQFLTSFQLTNRVVWDKPAVANLMQKTRDAAEFSALNDVPALANSLRECNQRRTRQTSAASKISNFAKPACKVFIWDDLASKSARWRDWLRNGAKGNARLNAKYVHKNGEHDYEAFFNACDRAYEDERARADFEGEARRLDNEFSKSTGIMADRAKIPIEFIRRRLLDKLMFWEGWSVKYGRLSGQ